MSLATQQAAERYRRLEAVLQRLSLDVYPEPPSRLHSSISQQMTAKLLQSYPQPMGARVLDVGCGQGVALELFAAAGLSPTGITLGPDAETCRAKGFDVIDMDLSFLDFPDQTFDLAWCRHALEHSVFPLFTLTEIARVLKPGGALYVEVPAPDTACRHETNANHYSVLGKAMWLELFRRAGFEVTWSADLTFTTPLGPDKYFAFIQHRLIP